MSATVECVLDIRAETGECPLWSVDEQCLYWIDVHKEQFNRFDPITGMNRSWDLPGAPGSFVLAGSQEIVLAMHDGFYSFSLRTGTIAKLVDAPYDTSKVRLSDGRTDRQGRFWAGAVLIDFLSTDPTAARSYYTFDGKSMEERLSPIGLANGTAFSPDGLTMYRSEWREKAIFAYDLDPISGDISGERTFAVAPEHLGAPDGAAIDTEGGYWSALPAGPNGGSVARFTPQGELDIVIEMPVAIPTMPAFGGPDMSTLYVTSASIEPMLGRERSRYSGGIFAIPTSFRGIPETRFKPA